MDCCVDILIATYNGEKYLKEQLDSILNQTHKNIVIYISDDASTDETQKILDEYDKKYDNIIVNYNKENVGIVKNYEFLLSNVKSKYYMMSDQDDVWYKDKIEKSLKALIDNSADLVFTDLEVVDKKLQTINKSFNRLMNKQKKIKKSVNSKKFGYLYNSITGCTIMAKSEFIPNIIPFPKESKYIIHDSWVGLVMSLNGKVKYLDEPTIKYRQHGNNQIGIKKKKYENFDEMREKFIDVKLDLFNTYICNERIFSEEMKNLNLMGKEYFERVRYRKNINFYGWKIFYKLYKDESMLYFLEMFIIFNFPVLARIMLHKRKGGNINNN